MVCKFFIQSSFTFYFLCYHVYVQNTINSVYLRPKILWLSSKTKKWVTYCILIMNYIFNFVLSVSKRNKFSEFPLLWTAAFRIWISSSIASPSYYKVWAVLSNSVLPRKIFYSFYQKLAILTYCVLKSRYSNILFQ